MATSQSTEQSNQNSGSGAGSVGQGIGRDANISASLLGMGDLDFSHLGAATSSATSGAVTVGDRILGGTKSSRQYGLVKILALVAGVAILYKLYTKFKKG